MMWMCISYVARRFVAPMAFARLVIVLLGWSTPALEELLALAVFAGFLAGEDVGTRAAVHTLARRDAR